MITCCVNMLCAHSLLMGAAVMSSPVPGPPSELPPPASWHLQAHDDVTVFQVLQLRTSTILACISCFHACEAWLAVCCWCQQHQQLSSFAHLSGQSAMLSCPNWRACHSWQVAGLAGEGQRRRGDLHSGIEQGLFETCANFISHDSNHRAPR